MQYNGQCWSNILVWHVSHNFSYHHRGDRFQLVNCVKRVDHRPLGSGCALEICNTKLVTKPIWIAMLLSDVSLQVILVTASRRQCNNSVRATGTIGKRLCSATTLLICTRFFVVPFTALFYRSFKRLRLFIAVVNCDEQLLLKDVLRVVVHAIFMLVCNTMLFWHTSIIILKALATCNCL